MARLTGPLLSFDAAGGFGSQIIFDRTRGVHYARKLTPAAQPQTAAQLLTRAAYATLSHLWRNIPSVSQNPWNAAARSKPYSAWNLWLKHNIPAWRGQPDRSALVTSPGNAGGLAATYIQTFPGGPSGSVFCRVYVPPAPTGWTADRFRVLFVPNGDPEDNAPPIIAQGQKTSLVPDAENTFTKNDLSAATDYVCSVTIEWIKPDGTRAYSPSLNALTTSGP